VHPSHGLTSGLGEITPGLARREQLRAPQRALSRVVAGAYARGMSDETLRSIALTKIGDARFKATNSRGGEAFMGSGGEDPDFTPIELLLAAIAGCSAIDVDLITGKRAASTGFEIAAEGHKVRDDDGNHLTGLRLTFDITFPDGPEGDAAREFLPRAMAMSRDRLCTVSRTVQLGADVTYDVTDPEPGTGA
jgi:putative redox protein